MRSQHLHTAAVLLVVSMLGSAEAFAQAAAPSNAEARQSDVARLQRELENLRQQYAERLAALEVRLAALEARQAPAPTPAPETPVTAQVPAGAAGAGGPVGALPLYGNLAATSKVFNPDVALIGDFLGASGTNAIDPQPALEMHESEASFQAIVDPYARADFFLSFGPEGVEVEEGFISFPTLPGRLLMKVGKLRSAFGKVNTLHNHALPWTDRPLVTNNLVGGEDGIADFGLSVSRLILNPWFFLEATGEVYNGNSTVFQTHERSDLTYVGHLRGYQDLTDSTNVDLGASVAYGHNDAGQAFTTHLIGLDATFRYRPLRRAIYRRLLARTELVWSRRQQAPVPESAFGFYASGDYQFARRWFAGARYDYSERAVDSRLSDRGASLLLTYWPSEFGQVRGQYRRTTYAEGPTANEFLFQFLFSIGAHGAHPF